MNMEMYHQQLSELKVLCDSAYSLAFKQNRPVKNEQEKLGAYIFAKMCLHSIAIIRMLPKSQIYIKVQNKNLWDISSVCAMVRCISDAYNGYYYLIIDDTISDDERSARLVLWDLHGECERLNMLETFKSENLRLADLRKNIDVLKQRLQKTHFFQSLRVQQRERYIKGRDWSFLKDERICQRAGINLDRYLAMDKYLSNHIHTLPFAIQQLNVNPNDPEGINLFVSAVRYCSGYLSLAIRDYCILFPYEQNNLKTPIPEIIKKWEYIMYADQPPSESLMRP